MKNFFLALICVPMLAFGCEYADDPRLNNEQLPALVTSIASGNPVAPIRVRVSTYLRMGERSQSLLEPHLQIFDVNCSPVAFFEGELLSRAVIPFEEFYRVMAYAIKHDQPDLAKSLFSKVRVAPMEVEEVQTLFGKLPYEGAFGVSVRKQMTAIFPMYDELYPAESDLRDPLKDGRLKDYAMIKLFRVFGGELTLNNGCGPYELHERFYKTERVQGFFGERDVVVVRREPTAHLMQTLGYSVVRADRITFRIKNCST